MHYRNMHNMENDPNIIALEEQEIKLLLNVLGTHLDGTKSYAQYWFDRTIEGISDRVEAQNALGKCEKLQDLRNQIEIGDSVHNKLTHLYNMTTQHRLDQIAGAILNTQAKTI